MTNCKTKKYKEVEEYLILIEEARSEGGERFAFLHLDVYKWNKVIFKKLQEDLNNILQLYKDKKYDLCGFYFERSENTKFPEKLKPLDFLVKKGGHSFGGWFLED